MATTLSPQCPPPASPPPRRRQAGGAKRGAEEAEGPAGKKPKAGLTPDIADKLTACSNDLSKGRKKRAVSGTGGCSRGERRCVVQACCAAPSRRRAWQRSRTDLG